MKIIENEKAALALIEEMSLKAKSSSEVKALQQTLDDIHAIARYRMPVLIRKQR